MMIQFNKAEKRMSYNGTSISAWNRVRRLAEGTRAKDKRTDVVKTSPLSGEPTPYDPHYFPNGTWNITAINAHPAEDTYLHPFFISTDAWQTVNTWTLDPDGTYGQETSQTQEDSAYGIHFSSSNTTLGCIRIEFESDLLALVHAIEECWRAGEAVQITVS